VAAQIAPFGASDEDRPEGDLPSISAAIRAPAPTSGATDCDPDFQAGAARIAE
jgi:hypothetical protein